MSRAFATLADELPVGMVRVTASGETTAANHYARTILEGAAADRIMRAIHQLCERQREAGETVEGILSLGSAGEVRLMVAALDDGSGHIVFLERSGTERLRAEIRALRAMLGSTSAPHPPRLAASKALGTLAGTLMGCHLILYELDLGRTHLIPIAQAGVPLASGPLAERLAIDHAESPRSSVERAVRSGAPTHVRNLSRSPLELDTTVADGDVLSALALPVRSGGEICGALLVVGPTETLGDGELRLLASLTDVVGGLLQRARHEALASRASTLVEELADAILEIGTDGSILSARGDLAIFGRSEQELIGCSVHSLVGWRDRQTWSEVVAEIRDGGTTVVPISVKHREGGLVHCEVTIHVEKGPEGRQMQAIFRDVSDKVALEERIREAERAAVAREQLAAIGQLSAGVAHEINNPLAFIKSNISSLFACLEDLKEGRAPLEEVIEELTEIATDCQNGTARILEIVDALKGMARNDKKETDFSPLKAIHDAVTVFRGAKKTLAEVELSLPDQLPMLRGSPGRFSQVIMNLLENGLDAQGGKGRLEVGGSVGDESVLITVRDHGSGIPEEVQERMWEPFFTTKGVGKGTGLGLAICRDIIEGMGGSIECETGPQGTTFFLRIPTAEARSLARAGA
ncbi:MAG: PAS domain S-box protein [Deltaproteobacteria bacterium]|nr:MAG: PAS domain S-box protein [Deltaproteobacteria bacterium]